MSREESKEYRVITHDHEEASRYETPPIPTEAQAFATARYAKSMRPTADILIEERPKDPADQGWRQYGK